MPPPKKGSNFISSVRQNVEHATLWRNMGERETLDQQNGTKSARLRLRHTGGEIVEVQGGHIVRSLARKDRHSKVCTAKGPRDRRLRLSAHTAIQFYDVQDRLGYDQPSKAVDWLIKEAKSSIDELANLPAWTPTLDSIENVGLERNQKQQEEPQQQQREHPLSGISSNSWVSNNLQMNGDNLGEKNSSFEPLSLDSDTIQSFFPLGASNSSVTQFQSFPPPPGLISTTSHSQDLGLSLRSFQDPIFRRHQQSLAHNAPSSVGTEWTAGGGGRFMFNPLPLFGQNQCVSQGGPLQSSNTQSVRAWIDPSSSFAAAADHHQQHHNNHHLQNLPIFSEFGIPARFQGEEEERYGISDKPSSVSSVSLH